ncbi:hypothetical protein DT019_20755 [Streptomyces sp. SDr-06]|nr:hypothetical protein DT019_20755 [Streptomyces sp. SDr-06]
MCGWVRLRKAESAAATPAMAATKPLVWPLATYRLAAKQPTITSRPHPMACCEDRKGRWAWSGAFRLYSSIWDWLSPRSVARGVTVLRSASTR